jgi:hypothetical protein
VALGLCLLSLAACSPPPGESTIQIEITGDPVDELRLHVAVEGEIGYLLHPGLSGHRVNVKGLDLRTSPYVLEITREQLGGPPRIWVLAEGLENDQPSSFNITDPPVAFTEGGVTRRTLKLLPYSFDTGLVSSWDTGCIEVTRTKDDGQEQTWKLATENDQDCDNVASDANPADCDDTDPAVNPQAAEICDGKDNNCDGLYLPMADHRSEFPCFGMQGRLCRESTWRCDEQSGSMGIEACEPDESDRRVPRAYCDAFPACAGSNPWACILKEVKRVTWSCTLETTHQGGWDVACGGGKVQLDPPTPSSTCRWELVDRGGLALGLADSDTAPHVPVAYTCSPYLMVAGEGGLGVPKTGWVVLEFFGEPDAPSVVIELTIMNSPTKTCSESPLSCNYTDAP